MTASPSAAGAQATSPAAQHTARLECPEFVRCHDRLPSINDNPPPWRYRGWLLPYVQMFDIDHHGPSSRWGFFLRTLEAGKLLDEPIPRLELTRPDTGVQRSLEKWAALIGWDMGGWSDFRALIDWLLWALALSGEEPRLHRDGANEKLYRAVDLTLLMKSPWDHFAELISERKGKGWNPTAFFPTPTELCKLMAEMTCHDAADEGKDTRLRKVIDPCCGTGSLLLAASNYSLSLWGVDIDPLVVACCKINGALFCPWLAFPLPQSILDPAANASAPKSLALPHVPQGPVRRVDDKGQGLPFPAWEEPCPTPIPAAAPSASSS